MIINKNIDVRQKSILTFETAVKTEQREKSFYSSSNLLTIGAKSYCVILIKPKCTEGLVHLKI